MELRTLLLVPTLLAASCLGLERRENADAAGIAEPEVFDVIRASNSKAAMDHLRRRYHEESAQVALLENEIRSLIAAQAGLASSLASYQEDFEYAKRRSSELQEQTTAAEAELAAAEAGQQESAGRLETARSAHAEQEAELNRLDGEVTSLRDQVDARRAEREALAEQQEAVESEIAELNASIARARDLLGENDAERSEQIATLRYLVEKLDPEGGDGGGL